MIRELKAGSRARDGLILHVIHVAVSVKIRLRRHGVLTWGMIRFRRVKAGLVIALVLVIFLNEAAQQHFVDVAGRALGIDDIAKMMISSSI